jgi:methyl-accepting chemotaxis protein
MSALPKYAQLTLVTITTALLFLVLEIIRPGSGMSIIGFGIIALLGLVSLRLKPDQPTRINLNPAVQSDAGSLEPTTQMLARAVEGIDRFMAQQANGAKEQVDLISRANRVLTDFVDLSGQVQEQTRSLAASTRQASESSANSSTTIRQVTTGMNSIRARVSQTADTVRRLSSFTRRIDDIIGSVSEIATQSNLLALNASIEAARAGVHGRGFAVVAAEVRSLSRQSTQAAKQVRAILEEIQSTMKQAIETTEAGLQEVDTNLTLTGQADMVMSHLGENITSAQQAANLVYEFVRQQATGVDEITIDIERMERIIHDNLNDIHLVATMAQELTRLADDLQNGTTASSGINQYAQHYAEQHAG